jgi:hypothetical protein
MIRAAALVVALASTVSLAPPAAGAPMPPTVAVRGSGAARALVRVDPRTLAPLRGSRRVILRRCATFAVSPDSTRVAVATEDEIVIADPRSGRVLRRIRNEGFDVSEGLYWVGTTKRPSFVAVGGSGLGWEYTGIPSDVATIHGLVLDGGVFGGVGWFYVEGGDSLTPLELAPPGWSRIVVDTLGDRVFVVYAAGVVAVLDGDGISYHSVQLGGGDFEATWAGNGMIALWGANGLGVIDTRSWTTSSLAPAATGAAATPFGLVAWNANAADGATVFARDGRRLHVLAGQTVRDVAAFGRYAYARVAARQYSVDLTTGRVRRIRADATVAIPSLVSLP